MVNIKLELQDRARDNMKTWYDDHTRPGYQFDRRHYAEFETFDGFMDDYMKRTRGIVERVLQRNGIEEGDFEFDVESFPEDKHHVAAQYHLRSDDRVVFKLNFQPLHTSLYDTISEPEERTESTLEHEVRHHVDRENIRTLREWQRSKGSPYSLNADQTKVVSVNTQNFLLQYLVDVRLEGFAEFGRKIIGGEVPKSIEDRADSFYIDLQDATEIVNEAYEFLSGREQIPIDEFDDKRTSPKGMSERGWPLFGPSHGVLNPYGHGNLMFKVLGLAERKKQMEKAGSFTGNDSLFEQNEFTEEERQAVSQRVMEMKSLAEFYNHFYRATAELELTDEEGIFQKELLEVIT
jgi:hypothetical protein